MHVPSQSCDVPVCELIVGTYLIIYVVHVTCLFHEFSRHVGIPFNTHVSCNMQDMEHFSSMLHVSPVGHMLGFARYCAGNIVS